MYKPESPFPIYCVNCWYSDKWDELSCGADYDFSKPFFEQMNDLFKKVPRANIFLRNIVNGEYSNINGESKNVYLTYSANGSENAYYSKAVDKSKGVFDCLNTVSCGNCYEVVRGENNYNCSFLTLSRNCIDSSFLYDCSDCSNCFLCAGLCSKKFCIENKQYSESEYNDKVKHMNTRSRAGVKKVKEKWTELILKFPHRYAYIMRSVNSTGDDLEGDKNVKLSFEIYNSENTKFLLRCFGAKDSYDGNNIANSEMVYEFAGGGANDSSRLLFSSNGIKNLRNAEYTDYCFSSSDVFGGISLRGKKYCILNRQYSEQEYKRLLPKVIQHMNNMPYKDASGNVYKYGEFFPPELSTFCYNESLAQEYFTLTKDEAEKRGYSWKDREERNLDINIKYEDIPDDIKNVNEEIVGKVIECGHRGACNERCTGAFKIIQEEFYFYIKAGIPLPGLCPNCRYYERLKQKNPIKLWHRACMCENMSHGHKEKCQNEFETPYAPERPEKIYCEECYNKEVY